MCFDLSILKTLHYDICYLACFIDEETEFSQRATLSEFQPKWTTSKPVHCSTMQPFMNLFLPITI